MRKVSIMPRMTVLSLFVTMLSLTIQSQEKATDCRVLLHNIKETYVGDCKNGFAHGKGLASGIDTYEGKFKKGLPHGKGTYTWANGNVYTGEWKLGKRSGKGTLYSASNGEEILGYWKDDEFVREIQLPEYKITTKYNVQSVSVKKIGDINNKVTLKLKRDGKFNSNMKDLDILTSGGVESKSQYYIYNNPIFPWRCTISFTALTRLSGEPVRCKVEVEIEKQGEWEIVVDY